MGRLDLEAAFRRAVESQGTVSATGDVVAQDNQGVVTLLTLTAGVDAATAIVRTGGASGTVLCNISAPIGTTVAVPFPAGMLYTDGIHVTLTGTAPKFDTVACVDTPRS